MLGGTRPTGPALQVAHRQVFRSYYGVRPLSDGVPRVIVLLTDGRSNVGVLPHLPAADLKAAGVNIFVIGVGAHIDRNELRRIASAPADDHTFLLKDFNSYGPLVNPNERGDV